MLSTFYKLIFDISCYFSFTSFLFCYLFKIETSSASFGVFVLVALALALGEHVPRGGNIIAVLGLLIPFLSVLWTETTLEALQVDLLWIYLVLVFVRKSYGVYHEEFAAQFKVLLWVLCLPGVLYLFDVEKGKPAIEVCIPFLIVFLISGVLLLQILRYQEGRGNKKIFEKHQIKQLVAFLFFCILITAGNLLSFLVNGIIKPLFLFLMGGLVGILYFLLEKIPKNSIGSFTDKRDIEEFMEQTPMFKDLPTNGWSGYGEIVQQQLEEAPPPDYTSVFVIAIIVVAVILFWVILGTAKKKKLSPIIEDEREELEETESPVKKARKSALHPEQTIRYCYRTFMKLVDSKGQHLLHQDTTADIANKYITVQKENRVPAEELTELYRRARYSGQPVKRQDAAQMRKVLKNM